MRPVIKLKPGSYIKPDGTMIDVLSSYNKYQDAKPALLS